MKSYKLFILILPFTLFSCIKERPNKTEEIYHPKLMEIPKGFPSMEFPENNKFTLERWELGKKLFNEKALSIDSSVSCASCHKPTLAFSDDVAFSPGVENRNGVRNSPTLANIGYHPYFTREGGVPTLEMQVLVPVQEHNEFGFNIVLISERLLSDTLYQSMAQEAYNQPLNPFVITRAISNFERTLISGLSPYDSFKDNINTLTAAQQRGMNLFFSNKTNCSSCHDSFNFTNYSFANNGLYENYDDPGRFRFTQEETDRALFKVPSLRNIELTAPYMHDGSIQTLEEVIDHYITGGKNHNNKSEIIVPLNLTDTEKQELILFLHSLTDKSFISNPLFTN